MKPFEVLLDLESEEGATKVRVHYMRAIRPSGSGARRR